MARMDGQYRPDLIEERWQRAWEEEGLYAAEPGSGGPTYSIAVPPPNVTGELHLGHAMNAAYQDVLIRWHRMRGFDVLWQPGYDHAGIGTQNVVERDLAKEGLTRQDLGREAFEARVWEWLERFGRVIMHQYRRLGASLDYRRERFTMDEAYVRAVLRFFVHLHRRGWIYRANRIVNWCPRCGSAISDLEVEHADVDDTLYYVRYPLADALGSRHRGHGAAGDDPRRRRSRRPSRGRALCSGRRQGGRRARCRAPGADPRRRAGAGRLRHRSAQDHPRPRSARLRDRPRPRPPRADRDRAGRAHERRGPGLRRA